MKTDKPMSLEQIRVFLEGSEEVRFEGQRRVEIYEWVNRTLVEQEYHRRSKAEKGLLRNYLCKMTGLSRAQVTRLITQYVATGRVEQGMGRRRRFPIRYTRCDIETLAETDEAHETLSGPATRQILYREYYEFHDEDFKRLSNISVAHIYNLRKRRTYRARRLVYEKTRPTKVGIGERRKPNPQGRPGYLRVDTVHQGDLDGVKGVYHINAVDEVTQWQEVGAAPQISEAWLKPVLEGMLERFPFRILGFHTDNGSEFINRTVSGMLNKLLVEQTKSRPNRSNDNGLAECKNGAVVRKHMGYGYIAGTQAEAINEFYREHFSEYLNFHRPCGVPEVTTDEKGKRRKVYRWYGTPWEILLQLPDTAGVWKDPLAVEELKKKAAAFSDTESARRMQREKKKLFEKIYGRKSA